MMEPKTLDGCRLQQATGTLIISKKNIENTATNGPEVVRKFTQLQFTQLIRKVLPESLHQIDLLDVLERNGGGS